MSKKKTSSHRERVVKKQEYLTQVRELSAYRKGHHDGFINCLNIMMFAIMEATNYRQNGLLKIWYKTLNIAEALEIPETGLTMEDIQLCLAAEGGIVSDEDSLEQAKLALDSNNGKRNKDYRKVIDDAMLRYQAIIDAKNAEQEGE